MEIFWHTVGMYNAFTWPLQLFLISVGIILTVKLYRNPTKRTANTMKIYMIGLNLWIAVVYYSIFGAERQYYYVFVVFWLILACFWMYDLFKGINTFERSYKYDKIVRVLYIVPFIYPLISFLRGMTFPEMTSPLMPCTVSIFTIGLLMSFSRKINLFLILFLFHWTWLSILKIYLYKMPEDILLTVCIVPAMFFYFKAYLNNEVGVNSKPSIRSIKLLLLTTYCIIGIAFSFIIFKSFMHV